MVFSKTEAKKPKIHLKKYHDNIAKIGASLCLVLFLSANSAFAITDEEQLQNLNQQIQSAQSKLKEIRGQKASLQNDLAAFDLQISAVEAQIAATQAEINVIASNIAKTNAQINQAEIDLATQRSIMKEYLRTIYIEGQTSTLELIAESENFSDFVDRSEYLGSVQEKVQETADKIVALKESLNQKKKELQVKEAKTQQLKAAQVLEQQSLGNQRSLKDNLLVQTRGNENSYQNLLSNLYQQRAAISAKNNEIIGGGGTSYPYTNANPDAIDPWGMYYRQCTSFAAWHSATFGPVPGSIISDWGHNHTANGGDWGWLGSTHGFTVDRTPQVGAIMSFPYQAGLPYGHVAIVTSIGSGGTVSVSEFNWTIPLGYGTRSNVNPLNYNAVFIHR